MFNYKEGSKTLNLADIECSSLGAGGASEKADRKGSCMVDNFKGNPNGEPE